MLKKATSLAILRALLVLTALFPETIICGEEHYKDFMAEHDCRIIEGDRCKTLSKEAHDIKDKQIAYAMILIIGFGMILGTIESFLPRHVSAKAFDIITYILLGLSIGSAFSNFGGIAETVGDIAYKNAMDCGYTPSALCKPTALEAQYQITKLTTYMIQGAGVLLTSDAGFFASRHFSLGANFYPFIERLRLR